MAVVDSLVVTLTLDPKDFQKGEVVVARSQKRMREEADRTDKQFQASARSIGDALNRTRNIALGLLTVFTAGRGISSFVQQTTESSAALGRLSRDLGVSTQALSAWEAVSRRAGNGAGEVGAAFANINARIQQFRLTGDASAIAGFRALRVRLSDTATGRARSNEDIYQDALDAIGRRAPGERLTAAGLIGGGQETVNLSALSRAQRGAMMAEGRSGDDTPEQVAAATRRRDIFLQAERALGAVGKRLLETFSPAIEAVGRSLRDFGKWLMSDDFKPVWERLQANVKQFTDYLGTDEFKNSMRALGDGIVRLAEKVIEALRWMGLLPAPAMQGPNPDGSAYTGETPATPRQGAPSGGLAGWFQRRFEQRDDSERRLLENRGGRGAAATPGDQQGRERVAYDFFVGRGYTPAQAAGMVGHLTSESGLRPDANNPAGGNYGALGIGQWRGPRVVAFMRQHQGRKPNEATLQEQLEFVDQELRTSERGALDALRATNDPRSAADEMFRRYGRPAPEDTSGPSRQARGQQLFQRFNTPQASPAPDPALQQGPRQGATNTFGGNNTSTSSVSIGAISVQTAATDAPGLARDLEPALRRYTFVEQSTVGLV